MGPLNTSLMLPTLTLSLFLEWGGGGGRRKRVGNSRLSRHLIVQYFYIDTSNITNRYATLAEDVDRLMEGVFGIDEEDGEELDSDHEPSDDVSSSDESPAVSDDELSS